MTGPVGAGRRAGCRRVGLVLWAVLLWCLAAPALAGDPCPVLRSQTASPEVAVRIAAYACQENQHWYRPFIDTQGHVFAAPVYEAESAALADGAPAWTRVATYWNESGLLPQVAGRPGGTDCAYAMLRTYAAPGCRTFIIDTPWSAAFVSWVMRRAALPGFTGSPSHVAYVRTAYRSPSDSPYRVQDPRAGKPERGDLLCYVRVASRAYGFADLAGVLSAPGGEGLKMHCDIVVAANTREDPTAYLVGGNVHQGVTLRMLPLAASGYFADLPTRMGDTLDCAPDRLSACNANRQDWAVLLKLRPPSELARLPVPFMPPTAPLPATSQPAQCCVNCVVGSGVPRCPATPRKPLEGAGGRPD